MFCFFHSQNVPGNRTTRNPTTCTNNLETPFADISCTFGAPAEFSTPASPGPRGTIICTPPPGASGRLPFALQLGDAHVPAARALAVTLLSSDSKAPVVLALSPSVGPASGTTSVTVRGAALPETLRCRSLPYV